MDRDGPLPDRLQRHISSCPSCRQFFEALSSMSGKLRQDLPEPECPEGDALCRRIVSAVDDEGGWVREIRRTSPWQSLWVPAAAACLLLLLVFVVFRSDRGSGETPGKADGIDSSTASDLPEWDLKIQESLDTSELLSLALLEEPLLAEAKRLTRDAEAVGAFFVDLLPLDVLSIGSNGQEK